ELHLFGLGQSLVVFEVVFLVVCLPLILPSRLGFQDMVFGDLTSIARGRLHNLMISFCLPFHLCSLISLQLSSIWKIVSGLKSGLMFLGSWLLFSLTHSLGALVTSIQSFVVLHRHRRLVYACLVCEL
ncbi:hypothetical protein HID58_059447, partial [Brassica napus]